MAGPLRRLLLLSAFLTTIVFAQSNCYHANGVDQNIEAGFRDYQSCGDVYPHSMCCRWNSTLYPDECRPDGLCLWDYDDVYLWRESCSDPTWESEGCLKLCIEGMGQVIAGDDTAYDLSSMNVQVTRCEDSSLCCGEPGSIMATDCCANGEGVWIRDGKVVTENPTKTPKPTSTFTSQSSTSTTSRLSSNSPESSGTVQASSSSSATTPQAAQPPSSKSPSSSKSTDTAGIIVGAVIGGILGLALLVALAWFLLRQIKLSRQDAHAELHSEAPTEPGTPLPGTKYPQDSVKELSSTEVHEIFGKGSVFEICESRTVHEVSGKGTVLEICGSKPVHEMDGSRPHIAELEGCTVKK